MKNLYILILILLYTLVSCGEVATEAKEVTQDSSMPSAEPIDYPETIAVDTTSAPENTARFEEYEENESITGNERETETISSEDIVPNGCALQNTYRTTITVYIRNNNADWEKFNIPSGGNIAIPISGNESDILIITKNSQEFYAAIKRSARYKIHLNQQQRRWEIRELL
jgi:hypothetical protein